ncbi:MAG: energy transducer TonB [Nitrospirota bacterium]
MRTGSQPHASPAAVSRLTATIVLPALMVTGCLAALDTDAVTIPPSRIEHFTTRLSTPVHIPPLLKPPVAHPDYPDYAMRHPKPGMVLLKIDIDAQGRVSAVEVIESTNILLESAARQAALQWSFEPARRHSFPVAATIVVPVEFTQGER